MTCVASGRLGWSRQILAATLQATLASIARPSRSWGLTPGDHYSPFFRGRTSLEMTNAGRHRNLGDFGTSQDSDSRYPRCSLMRQVRRIGSLRRLHATGDVRHILSRDIPVRAEYTGRP